MHFKLYVTKLCKTSIAIKSQLMGGLFGWGLVGAR